MRGEYTHETRASVTELGSPPLARGILCSFSFQRLGKRITPACAGNTRENVRRITSSGDHPRLRGEYQLRRKLQEVALGSPPLARGIHLDFLDFVRAVRITPACAGNTLSPKNKGRQTEDHPRLRGEYRQQSLMLSRYRGSPRLRGEYMSAASNITSAPGSPPLARGIQLIPGRRVSAIGITPACAGNTRRLTMAGCQYRDHPRLRGEY